MRIPVFCEAVFRVKNKIKEFHSDKEMPMYEELNPQNSMINMIISLDRKGVSNMNKTIRGRSMDILHNICQKSIQKRP